jgi:hypothetical protein
MLRRLAGWLMSFYPDEDQRPRRRRFACNIDSHHPYLRSEPNGGPQYVGCKFCDARSDR